MLFSLKGMVSGMWLRGRPRLHIPVLLIVSALLWCAWGNMAYADVRVNHTSGSATTGATAWDTGLGCSGCHGAPDDALAFLGAAGTNQPPNNTLAHYANSASNLEAGVTTSQLNGGMTVGNRDLAIANSANLSAYFASLLTPQITVSSTTAVTIEPGDSYPSTKQIVPVSGSDFLVNTTTYSAKPGNPLPTGFSIGATGTVTGTATGASAPVTFPVVLRATNGSLTGETPSFNITVKGTQVLTFAAAPAVTVGTTGTVSMTSSGGSGNPVVFTSSTPATCTVSSSTVTGVAVGTCTIVANQAGNASYKVATAATLNFSITKGNQSISFGAAPALTVGTAGLASATGGGSGNAVVFTSNTPTICSATGANGSVITGLLAGTCTIEANQAGNTNYNDAAAVTQNITVNKGSQTITYGGLPAVSVGTSGTLTATGGASGNPVTFTSTSTGVCTTGGTNGATVTGVSGGTCMISANQLGDTNYNDAATANTSFSIGAGSQTVSFGTAPTVIVGGTGSVTASASSGLAISSYSTVSTDCSVSPGGLVTGIHAGSNNCTITATQDGNASFTAASNTQTFSIGKADQTIGFGAAPTVMVGGTGTATATATSGLSVSFSTASSTCTVSPTGLVTGISTGSCVITADQAGGTDYNAAPTVTQPITIGLGSQTIVFGSAPAVMVDGTGTVSATGGASGNPVTFTSSTTGVCTVAGSTVTGVSVGTCSIVANQAGNVNYAAASPVLLSFAVSQGVQTISFGAAPTLNEGGTGTVTATATSGLAVTFSSTTTAVCTIAGSTVNALTIGSCIIQAEQAGDTNYTAAAPVTQTISVGAAPVVATAGTVTVTLNTAKVIDLSPFITGSGVTGVNVVAAPAHGSISVSGKQVTYTPVNNYFGADAFSYVAFGATGTSAPAQISVTVEGRPDPTQDTNTTAMMAAEMQSIQRFSQAQMFNFEQRMESLHGMPSFSYAPRAAGGGSGLALQPSNTLGKVEAHSSLLREGVGSNGQSAQLGQDSGGANTGVVSGNIAGTNLATSSATSAGMATGLNAGLTGGQQPMLAYKDGSTPLSDADNGLLGLLNGQAGSALLAALTTNTVNLAALNKLINGSNAGNPDAIQVWMAGSLRFGTFNNNGTSSLSNFKTDGVTIGADKRVRENLVLGLGLGYALDRATMIDDNSKFQANGMSLAVYGSYMATPNVFIDALMGYGASRFSTDRFVESVGEFAHASRRGDQIFGSISTGYEFREKGYVFSPYARADVAYNRLKEATEQGAGANALHYDEQTSTSTRLALGLRASATHQASFGIIIPRARVEYQDRMQDGGDTSIQFADQLGTSYFVNGVRTQNTALMFGLGGDVMLKNGVRLALDYQTLRSVGYETSQALSFKLTKELGVDNNQIPTLDAEQLAMPKLGVRVDMGYTFDDNVNRAQESRDKKSDHLFNVNLTKSGSFFTSQRTRIVLTGFLGGERAYYFRGLDKVSGGAQAEFQYRPSGEFGSPTLGVFARMSTEQFNSAMRDGYRHSVGVSLRKPVTDRITAFTALSYNIKDAKHRVFDTEEISLRGNVDYVLPGSQNTLYMTAEYRHGDIVSTSTGSLANLDGSRANGVDDVFVNQGFFSYRFGGDSILTTLGYNLPLGPLDGLDFSWRRVESTPSSVPSYVVKKSYVDNQFSIVYLVRF